MAKKATKKVKKKTTKPKTRRTAGPRDGRSASDRDVTPYPTAGDNPAFAAALKEELEAERQRSGAADEAKRGPGRPPGTGKHQVAARALNEQQISGLDQQIVCDMWKLPFELLAMSQKIEAWKLSDKETVALAKPTMTLLHHYAPGKLDPIQLAWYQLAGTLATLTVTRLLTQREILAARAATNKTAAKAGSVRPERQEKSHIDDYKPVDR